MDGEQIGQIVRYGVDLQGVASVSHTFAWPMLRFHPNVTDSHLHVAFGEDNSAENDPRFNPGPIPAIRKRVEPLVAGEPEWISLIQRFDQITHQFGRLIIEGELCRDGEPAGVSFRRVLFPSAKLAAGFDIIEVRNTAGTDTGFSVDSSDETLVTSPERGIYGAYIVRRHIIGAGDFVIKPGQSIRVATVYSAQRADMPMITYYLEDEESGRIQRLAPLFDKLKLETPEPVLNAAFAFAKMHAAESIFRTKVGPLHSPGGGLRYYAAIWANDEAEYANPFFGMLGDPLATESSLNSFRQFARFMNPAFKPIPSSIISEGDGVWHGAGDRGDMAMIAYGAGRFALAQGDAKIAAELWPLIEWCLEYLHRKVNARGVVESDSDELEGRFPAGKANLSTSSLYYDALLSAAKLGQAIGKRPSLLASYTARRRAIKGAIDSYFGAEVAGFKTYRYYDKADLAGSSNPAVAAYASRPDVLRAWIVVPLAMGILDRAEGTVDATFSDKLWTPDGLASEAGQTTIWDRATLYGLRGALAAGATERALPYLRDYTNRRLLGEHVPYPFEAYPEGGKAQLSAESALYCRIYTEGLFGIRPVALDSFKLTPRLPKAWSNMAIRSIHAFGAVFDIEVMRKGVMLEVFITTTRKRQKLELRDGGSCLVTVD